MKAPIPAFQRGTATGYHFNGRLLLTVTAAGATSPDGLIAGLLKATAPAGMMAGESLTEYAAALARRAGLDVARWEVTGNKREDAAGDFDPDVVY